MTGAVLEVRDLELRFEGLTALDGVSFDVRPGEFFAVVGPNGAGKTSILNCLSGLYRPQAGSVRFFGDELVGRAPHRIAALGLARTFQNVELFDGLSVVDNLMVGRHPRVGYGPLAAMAWVGRARREEARHRRAVEEIIELLEIEPYRRRLVGLLPYGIKKRVELGRALALEPRLLLLDEPVSGMNVEETRDMARFLLDVREELGLPLLLVEHHLGLVMDLAERVLVLDFGRVVACAPPGEIGRDPEVVRAYLGVGDGR